MKKGKWPPTTGQKNTQWGRNSLTPSCRQTFYTFSHANADKKTHLNWQGQPLNPFFLTFKSLTFYFPWMKRGIFFRFQTTIFFDKRQAVWIDLMLSALFFYWRLGPLSYQVTKKWSRFFQYMKKHIFFCLEKHCSRVWWFLWVALSTTNEIRDRPTMHLHRSILRSLTPTQDSGL